MSVATCAAECLGVPGGTFLYSDINFILLGEIVQRVSGRPLEQFVADEIYRPLKMNDTRFLPWKSDRPRVAPTERDGTNQVLRAVVHASGSCGGTNRWSYGSRWRVVLVRGGSGRGKTTLACEYINHHHYLPWPANGIADYRIDAVILEFNCNYIEGLKQPAMGRHWITFGEGLAKTFEAYFAAK